MHDNRKTLRYHGVTPCYLSRPPLAVFNGLHLPLRSHEEPRETALIEWWWAG